jgi:hypothetical protein
MTTSTPIRWKGLGVADRDCLVCEHVIGYRPTDNPDGLTDEKVIQFWNHPTGGCVISSPWQSEHQPEPYKHKWQHSWRNFRPTSDISAAFSVVEKMREKGFEVLIGSNDNGWMAKFIAGRSINFAIGKSLPECIALASLTAIGLTIEREGE